MSVRGESGGEFLRDSTGFGPMMEPAYPPLPSRTVGDVPSDNPWKAAYPNPSYRGRAHSHVVFGKTNRFRWQGTGNLSVKTVFSGHASIESDGGIHRIEPSTYVIINHGREYAVNVEAAEAVDGLSLFFEPSLTTSVIRSRTDRLDAHLDHPHGRGVASINFFERVFTSDAVARSLDAVRRELPHFHRDPMWVQESLHVTLDLMLDRHDEAKQEVESVCAVRAGTKEELYRRLYKARDYAYATLDQPVSLDDLSYVACLSTNYFLRSFRGLFRQTPHQFIIEKRVERARRLLTTTDSSVSEVCLAVGFQSLGSFSWLFKKKTGLSPEAFRHASAPCIR